MVGYGFRPTDDELVGYHLRNKIGRISGPEEFINEVDICRFDPWDLRLQAKIKSRDTVWYFFSRRDTSGNRQSRTTPSGFWKLTGEHVDVKDKWGDWCGIPSGKIGEKRVLGFHRGKSSTVTKGVKSEWVIHEYHYTLFPENKRSYVICRLEYKGNDRNMLTGNTVEPTPTFVANMTHSAGSVIDQSLQRASGSYNSLADYDSANQGQQFNGFGIQQSLQGNSANQGQQFSGNFDVQQSVQGNPGYFNHFYGSEYDSANQGQWFTGHLNLQQQDPYSAPYIDDLDEAEMWKNLAEQDCDYLVDERTSMQENYNEHRPRNPVTGILADDSSDSDSDSLICTDAWSSTDSLGSSNGTYQTPIDDIPLLSTIEPLHYYEAQEQPKQLKLQSQDKEKVIIKQKNEGERKVAENSIKKTSSTNNTLKQNWIVLEEMMSQRNSQWIYLKNMIVGFLLLLSVIGWIVLVG